ncbi:hypothetical protein [Streptomyces sp. NPDC002205]|uniref:hypothetical protein n=1 Tax=Streptomyces sp. NPDC002205 TaxID=3154411 RepID=UPI00332B313D
MRAAEDEAVARGCTSMIVSSMSFQAPGFYRRQGYLETGSGGGIPGGHTRHHFFKELGADGDRQGRFVESRWAKTTTLSL